jgi:hypothetical protein
MQVTIENSFAPNSFQGRNKKKKKRCRTPTYVVTKFRVVILKMKGRKNGQQMNQ